MVRSTMRIYFRGNQCNRNEAHDSITGETKIQFRMVFFSSAEVYGDYEGVMTEDVMEKNLIRFRYISDERLRDNKPFLRKKSFTKRIVSFESSWTG